jgi:hypothetical protein|tara:strand:- start:16500 stop:16835 length:336 start_codon:yes stop_codon:yes gene_type:complete
MHNELFHGTLNVITWKVPDAKCVVDGVGMDGVLREGSWEGPGDPPTTETIEGWKQEFVDEEISIDLDAESRVTDEALAASYAVFEVTTGSPPTDTEKQNIHNAMVENMKQI